MISSGPYLYLTAAHGCPCHFHDYLTRYKYLILEELQRKWRSYPSVGLPVPQQGRKQWSETLLANLPDGWITTKGMLGAKSVALFGTAIRSSQDRTLLEGVPELSSVQLYFLVYNFIVQCTTLFSAYNNTCTRQIKFYKIEGVKEPNLCPESSWQSFTLLIRNHSFPFIADRLLKIKIHNASYPG